MNRRTIGIVVISIFLIAIFVSPYLSNGEAKAIFAKPIFDEETIARANQLYINGHYQEAATAYQQLVDQGYADSSLYYNLGNTYYRLGDLGWAIYYYEQALRLAPRDSDIKANLNFVRSQTVDQFDQASSRSVSSWFRNTEYWLTDNEVALITLVLFWLLAILLVGFRHTTNAKIHRGLGYSLTLVGIIFILTLITFGGRVYAQSFSPQAIVTVESVNVLDSPGGEGSNFTLHSGSKINYEIQIGQWAEIRLPGEQFHGWVSIDDIAILK